MNHSLSSACAQFEQVLLCDMLRAAGLGKRANVESEDESEGSAFEWSPASQDAVQNLFVQALAAMLQRAGGIGIADALGARLRAVKR